MNFARLTRADAIAMVAAFALLFSMALTWYSTIGGDTARQIEDLAQPQGADQQVRDIRDDARFAAEGEERNAWQASGAIDRIILAGLLTTVILAVGAAYLRAGGRRLEPPRTLSAAAAVAAGVTALLVAYRTIQEPGLDATTTVEAGAPIGLGLLVVITFASRAALREELAGTAWREPAPSGGGVEQSEPERGVQARGGEPGHL